MEKKKIIEFYLNEKKEELFKISSDIYHHPEMAFEEYYASEYLSNYLQKQGFEIKKPHGTLETSFEATFKNGENGPTIAILAEYDALSNGHACGHNVIAASGIGAGIGAKHAMEELNIFGTLKIIGTPAEETGGGKIIILENGGFDGVDAALLLHPTTGKSKVAGRCKSSHSIEVTYTGQLSSAISRPERGVNATEATVLAYQYLANALRYLPNDVSIMPFIMTANENDGLLPVTSTLLVTITAFEDSSMEKAIQRVKEILEGAALTTGNQFEIKDIRGYQGRVINETIGNLLRENMILFDEPIMDGMVDDSGFEDFGNVNRVIPGAMVYPTLLPSKKVSNHTDEFLELSNSPKSKEAILLGSKVMASTAIDLFLNPELLQASKKELEEKSNGK